MLHRAFLFILETVRNLMPDYLQQNSFLDVSKIVRGMKEGLSNSFNFDKLYFSFMA